jgi:hypothetical protein
MDRRKLIVGGGAAAVVTTFAAVAGERTPAAAVTTVEDHAQRVVDLVDAELGLVDPAGLRHQIERGYATYVASAPRDPDANDLDAWVRQRMVELCGTDSYAAVMEIPETRLLLAFNFLAYSQNQSIVLTPVERSVRVPVLLRTLEPDFLPVLLRLVQDRVRTSREFAAAIQASSAELDRFVQEKLRSLPNGGSRARAQSDGKDALNMTLGFLVILGTYYYIRNSLRK